MLLGIGRVGLDEHLGRASPSPGPARDLGQQAEGALGGAVVGEVQAGVGIDYSHELIVAAHEKTAMLAIHR